MISSYSTTYSITLRQDHPNAHPCMSNPKPHHINHPSTYNDLMSQYNSRTKAKLILSIYFAGESIARSPTGTMSYHRNWMKWELCLWDNMTAV